MPPIVRTDTSSEGRNQAGHSGEIAAGSRFQFGKNWAKFLDVLDE